MGDSIKSRKPPVFELVAATPHRGAALKLVRIPRTAKKYQIPGWVPEAFGRGCGIRYNQGSHQFLNWWQQHPTGVLHQNGFESLKCQKEKHPKRVLFFLAEDEGFEPPQTESESGVLPLHKSSTFGTVLLYPIFGKCQALFFKFLLWLPGLGRWVPCSLLLIGPDRRIPACSG